MLRHLRRNSTTKVLRDDDGREVSVVRVYIFAGKTPPRGVERDHIKTRYETVKAYGIHNAACRTYMYALLAHSLSVYLSCCI